MSRCDALRHHPEQIRLGITGGIGSGKSYVAHMLESEWGVPVYDCDSHAKRITAQSYDIRQALTQLVGTDLWQEGVMQKHILATYLFACPNHAAQVNAIIHPAVRQDFLQWADSLGQHPVVAMESAILCESGFHTLTDALILVDAPMEIRLERAMQRDGASRQQIEARMARQDSSEARRLARFIVHNDGCSHEALHEQLAHIMEVILRDATTNQDIKKQTN